MFSTKVARHHVSNALRFKESILPSHISASVHTKGSFSSEKKEGIARKRHKFSFSLKPFTAILNNSIAGAAVNNRQMIYGYDRFAILLGEWFFTNMWRAWRTPLSLLIHYLGRKKKVKNSLSFFLYIDTHLFANTILVCIFPGSFTNSPSNHHF